MGKAVVVVESPAKAKTIHKYLGADFTVLASYGHVRDLPSKDGSVRPEEDFAMTYVVDAGSKKQLSAISTALKGAEHLYLATDPDREGEAISWHVLEALKSSKALKDSVSVSRIVFHEITKKAVTAAIENPRDIDMDLVDAQQARRALDYLVGFNLSPVLWRKLPGSRSAGRVQSVALRLICERDAEIEVFKPKEFWSIDAVFANSNKAKFSAKLTHFEGEKLEKFSVNNTADATRIEDILKNQNYTVKSVTPKTSQRKPYAPFTTSTLQMDASRKLGFSAKRTMQVAQKLYEGVDIGGETVGLITYMRTDGVTVSTEAIMAARVHIEQKFGKPYLPDSPRMYKTKTKNAQEAHEAIRPTDIAHTPEAMERVLEGDMAKLYTLIYKRMLASQMQVALFDQMAIEISDPENKAIFRATGSTLKFDGFLKLYQVGKDDGDDTPSDDEDGQRLPPLNVGEALEKNSLTPNQHFTQAPPRYSEATLVKRLEELGIGRPSTFASIISVLQDRGYTSLEKRRFVASSLGRIVTAFLMTYFPRYVEYDFTADLEQRLDLIADGKHEWKAELRDFWKAFSAQVDASKELTITEVLESIEQLLIPYLFGVEADEKQRVCPTCDGGKLSLKTGKFGAFLGCSNYPECKFTRQLATAGEGDGEHANLADESAFPKDLGADPKTGESISLRKGPYGFYVQLGEGKKPKRSGIPKGQDPMGYDLEKALSLLALPREVGAHPETGDMIQAGVGRFGPYLLYQKRYVTLPKDDDVLSVGMNRAVALIAEKAAKGGGAATVLKSLGKHPDSGDDIDVLKGRYGPYIKFNKKNVSLPKSADVDSFTLEDALPLLAKIAGKKAATKKKPAAKKTTAKKATTKKPAAKKSAKKPATKKTAPKKPAAKKA
jgi:DNA topoisomerase-1